MPGLPLPPDIVASRLIAVLRAPTADHLIGAARVLMSAGVRCIEIALTTPDGLAAIEELAATSGGTGACVGAGSVLTAPQAADAVAAGAGYLLSPIWVPEVVQAATSRGVPVIPGAATPTEIASAWQAGCSAVKVFPAASLGGPAYVRSVLEPLPQMALVPTGGVREGDVVPYLEAGAAAVGVGSPLTGTSLVSGEFEELGDRARAFLDAAARHPVSR